MARTFYLYRRGRAFYPVDGMAEAEAASLPSGKPLKATFTVPRSLPQHRLYWGMLKLVSENCELSEDDLHQLVKYRLGYSRNVQMKNGDVVTLHGSIAFDKMDGPEFNGFMDKATDFLCQEVIPGLGHDDLLDQVKEMLGEAA